METAAAVHTSAHDRHCDSESGVKEEPLSAAVAATTTATAAAFATATSATTATAKTPAAATAATFFARACHVHRKVAAIYRLAIDC